jgi:thiamine biosynthesis lipoprotein
MTAPLTARRRVEHCMGTVFSFDIRPPAVNPTVVEEAVQWLHQVDATFSTYRADSQINRLARGEIAAGNCTPEVVAVLQRCAELEQETGGFFSARPAGTLDPSGYVKGWATQTASNMLVAAGSTNHCVNGGGDVQCAGDSAPGQPWRIGIAHPHQPGYLAAIVTGTGIAVATSGTAERGTHVLDPHTHLPPHGHTSITVVGPHLGVADAYATAAFAMGTDARDWLETRPEYHGFGITTDGTTWATSGWADNAGEPVDDH